MRHDLLAVEGYRGQKDEAGLRNYPQTDIQHEQQVFSVMVLLKLPAVETA